jgi:hypothetical protein
MAFILSPAGMANIFGEYLPQYVHLVVSQMLGLFPKDKFPSRQDKQPVLWD